MSTRRHPTAFGLLIAAVGAALLVWLIRKLGPAEIWHGMGQIGWGLVLIVALGGLRFAARAVSWCLCFEPPARLRFRHAFAAVLAGDAIGNLTPLGPIVSEPAKAAFVRHRTDFTAAATALAIENVFYTLSVVAMIAAATIALLFSFELPGPLRESSEVGLAVIGVMIAAALLVLWRRPAVISRALGVIARPVAGSPMRGRLDKLQQLEEQIYSFSSRRRAAVLPLMATETTFHALGVLEVYVTLWLLLGTEPPLLTAFVFEGANRLVNVVFKFVPLRLGPDEGTSAGLAPYVGLAAWVGTTLAIARKVRMAVWSVVGMILLVSQGLNTRQILENTRLAAGRDA